MEASAPRPVDRKDKMDAGVFVDIQKKAASSETRGTFQLKLRPQASGDSALYRRGPPCSGPEWGQRSKVAGTKGEYNTKGKNRIPQIPDLNQHRHGQVGSMEARLVSDHRGSGPGPVVTLDRGSAGAVSTYQLLLQVPNKRTRSSVTGPGPVRSGTFFGGFSICSYVTLQYTGTLVDPRLGPVWSGSKPLWLQGCRAAAPHHLFPSFHTPIPIDMRHHEGRYHYEPQTLHAVHGPAGLGGSPVLSDISLIRLSPAAVATGDSPFSPPHPYAGPHMEHYLRSVHAGAGLSMMSAARGLSPAELAHEHLKERGLLGLPPPPPGAGPAEYYHLMAGHRSPYGELLMPGSGAGSGAHLSDYITPIDAEDHRGGPHHFLRQLQLLVNDHSSLEEEEVIFIFIFILILILTLTSL
ncbi:uncharacterized protein V6R79_014009 [Siganus canaliculatus]